MAGFNPLLAFGSGLANGISSAEADKQTRQNKIDDEYRQAAIKVNTDSQIYSARKKINDAQTQQDFTAMSAMAGINKANTTNQASYDALKQAQTQPDISQNTSITGNANPPPTNTPQTSISNPASMPSAGGMNSPQGGTVPLQMTPEQGDATNPLAPPTAQQNDNVNPSGGTPTNPSEDDEITDSFNNKLTRSQASRAVAYGMEISQKTKGGLDPQAAYWAGIGKVMKEDGHLGSDVHNTGQNSFGFTIGTVPDGFTVPALPEKFDVTKRMTEGKASQKLLNDEKELSKDKDAAIQANKAATEFSMYLSGNESGDSGGLNKIGFIRDFTGAMGSKDATLDSINKSLTFNIVGFERTPGMRLTQAEFFIAREAMPGRGNTPEANKNIAQFWQAKLQLPQEFAQFKQDYMSVNGSWNEAIGDRMFQQYQKDNPIFDPQILANPESAQMSDFKLNPHRQTLEQYSKSGGWNKLGFLGMKQQSAPVPQANTQEQTAPKVIGTWNPKTGQIE